MIGAILKLLYQYLVGYLNASSIYAAPEMAADKQHGFHRSDLRSWEVQNEQNLFGTRAVLGFRGHWVVLFVLWAGF